MRVPQELVDSIIDTFVLRGRDKPGSFLSQKDPEVESTLKVLRARVSGRIVHERFLDLLSSSPHIGAFVRTLAASYMLSEDHPISEILTSLLHLECIILNPHDFTVFQQVLRDFPTFLGSCALAFSLPSVRHIELGHLIFSDAVELESLLRGSTSLKKLLLRSCSFENTYVTLVSGGRSISLDSLDLFQISDDKAIQSMIDSFVVVDITHLRSLRLHFSAVHSIVTANAASLEDVDIKYQTEKYYQQPFVPETFAGDSNLQHICLDVWETGSFAPLIRSFGQLKYLRKITLNIRKHWQDGRRSETGWLHVADVLAALQSLAEINIHVYYRHMGGNVENRFPSLAQKGLLHLVHIYDH